MTDLPENSQQNLTKPPKRPPVKTSFKPGYDPRRWLGGRGKKSPEQKEADEIFRAVYWKELMREFDARTGKPVIEETEPLTAMELAARKQIKTKFEKVEERLAGKVTEHHDLTTQGEKITTPINIYLPDNGRDKPETPA